MIEAIADDRPATLPPARRNSASSPAPGGNVRLPVSYLEAKAALEHCDKLDEVASWADRAAALATYAAQARDTELERTARRIRARAVRRAGELLQAIPTARGRRTDLRPESAVGARTRAAAAAGMSESQHKVAVRLAKIPGADFEAAVEVPDPPGVARLAGRAALRPPPPAEDAPAAFDRASGLLGAVIVIYRTLPPLLRQKFRNRVLRAFADTVDTGDDCLSLAQASSLKAVSIEAAL